ncbi:hypothetical protein PG985_011588 [Apiospora marii]|uniref:Uncharacterized protein n=1 Tax=Apiospora marii TaxID=335849 RepID=A0ABR1R0N7_9PEZI
MAYGTPAPARTNASSQDVVEMSGYSKISKENDFWDPGNIKYIKWIFWLLVFDPLVSKHSDAYMRMLQILVSYFAMNLDVTGAIYLEQQAKSHEGRYGLPAFATCRAYLNLFRFYWANNKLQEAKAVANYMAKRLQTDLNAAPDAFLIWKTLATDVECRDGDPERAAALYGDLAYRYRLHDDDSNRSYYFLHFGLQLFYTGRSRWREAISQIEEAIKFLAKVPSNLQHATETIVERKIALLVLKAAMFEALGEGQEATWVYNDLIALCERHLEEDPYIESWHAAADNRIFVLNHPQSQEPPPYDGSITASVTAAATSPVLLGISPDWPQSQEWDGDCEKGLQGWDLVSSPSVDNMSPPLMAAKLARTAGRMPSPSEPFNRDCSASTGVLVQLTPEDPPPSYIEVPVGSPVPDMAPEIINIPTMDEMDDMRDTYACEQNTKIHACDVEYPDMEGSSSSDNRDSEDGLMCLDTTRKTKYTNDFSAAQKGGKQARKQRITIPPLVQRSPVIVPMWPKSKEASAVGEQKLLYPTRVVHVIPSGSGHFGIEPEVHEIRVQDGGDEMEIDSNCDTSSWAEVRSPSPEWST